MIWKITFILLFVVYTDVRAQHVFNPKWDRASGGNNLEEFVQILQTSDGGYIVAGNSNSGISGDKTQNAVPIPGNYMDYWIIKLDSAGVKQWDRRYGSNQEDYLNSIQPTSDGGYILTGTSWSGTGWDKTCGPTQSGTSRHGWVVKIDSLGNIMWDECFGQSQTTILEHLEQGQETTDGGYMFAGHMYPPSVNSTYWLIKTNSLGVQQWDVLYGGSGNDFLSDAKQTPDGGFILGGESDSPVSGTKGLPCFGGADYWIVKTNSLGVKQWEGVYGGTGIDLLTSIVLTNDNGYLLSGYSYSGISGNKTQPNWDTTGGTYDYWIVKVDSAGNMEWDKHFGGSYTDRECSTILTSDNGFLITGVSGSGISGDKTEISPLGVDPWIVKVDSMGNLQWEKTVFTRIADNARSIQTADGDYVIGCTAAGNPIGFMTHATHNLSNDYWILKSGDSIISTSVSVPDEAPDFQITPNPARSNFSVSLLQVKIIRLEIFDYSGRTIYRSEKPEVLTFECDRFERGVYFVSIKTDKGNFVKKLLLE